MKLGLDIGLDPHLLDPLDIARPRAKPQSIEHMNRLLLLTKRVSEAGIGLSNEAEATALPGSLMNSVATHSV